MLEEEKDEATKEFALDLIKKSAATASAKLQFCRIAFGAAGSAGAQIDLGDAETIARGFLEDDKTKIAWNLPRALLAKNRVKLLLNMLVIAGQAIPRGGKIAVDPIGAGDSIGFKVAAAGTNAKVPPAVPALLTGEAAWRESRCTSDSTVLYRTSRQSLRGQSDGDDGRRDRRDHRAISARRGAFQRLTSG